MSELFCASWCDHRHAQAALLQRRRRRLGHVRRHGHAKHVRRACATFNRDVGAWRLDRVASTRSMFTGALAFETALDALVGRRGHGHGGANADAPRRSTSRSTAGASTRSVEHGAHVRGGDELQPAPRPLARGERHGRCRGCSTARATPSTGTSTAGPRRASRRRRACS